VTVLDFSPRARGAIDDGTRQWVLAALLHGGGQLQHFVLRAAEHMDPDQCRPADGQRAGLVKDHRVDAVGAFQ
jgi:hypothetical protein